MFSSFAGPSGAAPHSPINRTIALPFFGKMTKAQIERVCDTLEKVLEKILMSRKGRF